MSATSTYVSQDGQDKFVDDHFHQKTGGVFVEVGAHDGVSLSNTMFLEQHRGWTGLLIEPNPTVTGALAKNRPRCVQEHVAAHHTDGQVLQFRRLTGYTEMLSGLTQDYDTNHQRRIDKELELHGGTSELIDVPCARLDTLFLKHGLTHIDYLSIDTEGSELAVLEGIDWQRVHIELVGIEVNYAATQGAPLYAHMMLTQLYDPVAQVGQDWFFKRRTQQMIERPLVPSHASAPSTAGRIKLDDFITSSLPDMSGTSHIYTMCDYTPAVYSHVPHDKVFDLIKTLVPEGQHVRVVRLQHGTLLIKTDDQVVRVLQRGLANSEVARICALSSVTD